ncbi:NIPSNAP family containing protein [Kriegella sp. EG-1]|nr:NIPSNAP family containing protein [Flavobacteriaceae bacterium EG-1]
MKTTFNQLVFILCITFFISQNSFAQEQQEFYQLKIYSFDNEQQIEATDNYLKNAFLPALKDLGVATIGVFKNRDSIISKTYVLIPFKTMDDFLTTNDKLITNKLHNSKGNNYLEASHDNAPYKRIQTILIKAFIDMPKMALPNLKGPRKDRVYELRSYESATEKQHLNKVDMFNAGGEVPLFDSLGFNAVFYGTVLSGANMPNLIYMTTHENQEAQKANWKSFSDSPIWHKLKSKPEYQNNVSHIDKYMLYPTDYSDY